MAFWTYNGLKFGIKSVKFPKENDFYGGFASSVKIDAEKCLNRKNSAEKCKKCEAVCPTGAINLNNLNSAAKIANPAKAESIIEAEKCIMCGLCIDACTEAEASGFDGISAISYDCGLNQDAGFKNRNSSDSLFKKKIFKKSLFVKHIDTGSCGACESEIKALNNPYYNMHRLGIFITPSPRFADVLLVTGTFTKKMSDAFFSVLDNIPMPRFIVLAGSCAIFGGIFGENGYKFNAGALNCLEQSPLINENIIAIPHCPPNPFEILNVLLLIKSGDLK